MVHQVGDRFGRWTLLERLPARGTNRRWLCMCDCERVVEVAASNLVAGKSTQCRSCGAKARWERVRKTTK